MIFHDYTFAWWQMAMFKVCLISLGLIIGAKWPKIFGQNTVCWILFVLVIGIGIYLATIAF
ncbi:MAG: hypothetical protein WCP93_02625 [Candidatus Berkelbacteria bacterium]